jgi:hypothetical protein
MSYSREMANMLIAQKGACGITPCIQLRATSSSPELACPCYTKEGCEASIISRAHDNLLSPCAAAVQVARQWLIDNPSKEEPNEL